MSQSETQETQDPKPKVGRPTKYHDGMPGQVLEMAAEGQSQAEMAWRLGICTATWHRWVDENPTFKEATLRARELARGWWEAQGRENIGSREFNANLWSLNVRNRFSDHWADRKELAVSPAIDFLNNLMDDQPERIDDSPPLEVDAEVIDDHVTNEDKDESDSVDTE